MRGPLEEVAHSLAGADVVAVVLYFSVVVRGSLTNVVFLRLSPCRESPNRGRPLVSHHQPHCKPAWWMFLVMFAPLHAIRSGFSPDQQPVIGSFVVSSHVIMLCPVYYSPLIYPCQIVSTVVPTPVIVDILPPPPVIYAAIPYVCRTVRPNLMQIPFAACVGATRIIIVLSALLMMDTPSRGALSFPPVWHYLRSPLFALTSPSTIPVYLPEVAYTVIDRHFSCHEKSIFPHRTLGDPLSWIFLILPALFARRWILLAAILTGSP